MVVRKISLKEIIDSIQERYHLLGSMDIDISGPSPIDRAESRSICYCKKKDEQALDMIKSSRAKVIVCSDKLNLKEADYPGKTLIQVANPRLAYSRILQEFFTPGVKSGIHPTAVISKKASIGHGVCVGPYSYIAECEIGSGTVIDGHVHIYNRTRIGKNVIVHAGVVIGAEAVGFERDEKGEWVKFPQISGVVIEDNVEVGANSVVCRGSLSDTIIGKGTKVDNLVRVGHGVVIGRHCIVIAGAIICGSVKIGDYTWIGPLSCIRENIRVGNKVLVGMGSVVQKDIGDNLVVSGSPARPIGKNTSLGFD
jgi:UDP-3-O-[3-hydroxymyristoyl] glucosamine N-acyltransferase